jgi:DNA-directed RNA polymerase subunit beta
MLKELQSLGLDVKVLGEDQQEVKLLESVDYGDTDLRSVIEGDRRYRDREEESLGSYGFSRQEFEGDELVTVEEEDSADAAFELEETFDEE